MTAVSGKSPLSSSSREPISDSSLLALLSSNAPVNAPVPVNVKGLLTSALYKGDAFRGIAKYTKEAIVLQEIFHIYAQRILKENPQQEVQAKRVFQVFGGLQPYPFIRPLLEGLKTEQDYVWANKWIPYCAPEKVFSIACTLGNFREIVERAVEFEATDLFNVLIQGDPARVLELLIPCEQFEDRELLKVLFHLNASEAAIALEKRLDSAPERTADSMRKLREKRRNFFSARFAGELFLSSVNKDCPKLRDFLLNNLDIRAPYLMKAFIEAARRGDLEMVKLLLPMPFFQQQDRSRAGLDSPFDALYEAATQGHTEIVKLLEKENKAKIFDGFLRWELAVSGAAGKGHWEIVRLLLMNIPQGVVVDVSGTLLVAIDQGQIEMVNFLLDTGRIDAAKQEAALQIANLKQKGEIAQLLSAKTATSKP